MNRVHIAVAILAITLHGLPWIIGAGLLVMVIMSANQLGW